MHNAAVPRYCHKWIMLLFVVIVTIHYILW